MPAHASDTGELLEVMVLDADRSRQASLAARICGDGRRVCEATSADDLLAAASVGRPDVLLVDPRAIQGDAAGWLAEIRRRVSHLAIVLLAAAPGIEAVATLTKPITDDMLAAALGRAERHARRKAATPPADPLGLANVLGCDPAMLRAYDLVDAVADSKATVLLTGEPGTGKTLLARAIHARSSRRGRPLVEVACGSMADGQIEAELVGTVDQPGRLAIGEGGTLLLDEVHAASPAMQLRLSRVLQDRAFAPAGSTEVRPLDARVIVAAHGPLEPLVRAGRFRRDLYDRVNVVPIPLPPLRERPADIATLADALLMRFATASRRPIVGFTPAAMDELCAYGWPGNVREMESVIERAVLLAGGPAITARDLPGANVAPPLAADPVDVSTPMPLEEALAGPERRIIEAALHRNGWARQATARELGIERTTLYKKMRRHGLIAPRAAA